SLGSRTRRQPRGSHAGWQSGNSRPAGNRVRPTPAFERPRLERAWRWTRRSFCPIEDRRPQTTHRGRAEIVRRACKGLPVQAPKRGKLVSHKRHKRHKKGKPAPFLLCLLCLLWLVLLPERQVDNCRRRGPHFNFIARRVSGAANEA